MFIVPITGMQPMQSIAGAQKPQEAEAPSLPFADVLQSAMSELAQAQAQSQQDSYDLAMGNTDDIAGIMVNSQRLAAAVEMTTQLTSRAVSAYKEILQMQV